MRVAWQKPVENGSGRDAGRAVTTLGCRADKTVVSHTSSPSSSSSAAASGVQLRFGLPVDRFAHAWRIDEIARYLGLEKSGAYRLMRTTGAPPRLLTGTKAYRWDGEQVMAWVRGMDWRTVHAADGAIADPVLDEAMGPGSVSASAIANESPPPRSTRPAPAHQAHVTDPLRPTAGPPRGARTHVEPGPASSHGKGGAAGSTSGDEICASEVGSVSNTSALQDQVVVDPVAAQHRARAARMAALLGKSVPPPQPLATATNGTCSMDELPPSQRRTAGR